MNRRRTLFFSITSVTFFLLTVIFVSHKVINLSRKFKMIGLPIIIGIIFGWIIGMLATRQLNSLEEKVEERTIKLEEAKDYAELIKEVAPAGIFTIDKNYIIQEWNRHAEEITGYGKKEVIGKRCGEIFGSDPGGKKCTICFEEEKQKSSMIDCKIEDKEGAEKFITKNSKLLMNRSGEVMGAIECFYDITERKKLKNEIVKLKNRLEKYLEVAKVIFLVQNREGRVTLINERGAEILGYTKEELLGKNWMDEVILKKDRKRLKEIFDKVISGEIGLESYYEHEVLTKDGGKKFIGWNNTLLKSETGEIEGVLSAGMDITDRKELEEKLKYQATIDGMTGIYNRRTGMEFLEKKLKLAKRKERDLSICFVDADGLKDVNDKYGHEAGDDLIINMAEIMKDRIRESDIICRMGGDEFLIVFPECSLEEAKDVVERIEEEINQFNTNGDKTYNISLSYGLASYNGEDGISMDELIAEADKEMYRMKEAKKQSA